MKTPTRFLILTLVVALFGLQAAVPAGAQEVEDSGPNEPAVPQAADEADDGEFYASDVATGLKLEGRGYGHGRGLSQYGALAYAVQGSSYSQILAKYYAGTNKSSRSDTQMLVTLSAHSGSVTMVYSEQQYSVAGFAIAAGLTAKVEAISSSRFRVSTSPSICGGTFTSVTEVNGTEDVRARYKKTGADGYDRYYVEIHLASNPVDDYSKMLQTCKDGNRFRAYRGSMWALAVTNPGGSTTPYTLNSVPLENYVRGVVPRESPASWGAAGSGRGLQALKAQAVAARSYALRLAETRIASNTDWTSDTCDTTACQVYMGAGSWQISDAHWLPMDSVGNGAHTQPFNAYSVQAVTETAGEVREWPGGQVALTEFASSHGGYWTPKSEGHVFGASADLDDRYLFDADERWIIDNQRWTRTIPYADIEAAYPNIGKFKSFAVTERNGLGAWGGRTRKIVITGTAGSKVIKIDNWAGDSFRKQFGLRSDWYREVGSQTSGFWLVRPDGEVRGYGGAVHLGDMKDRSLNRPIVGIGSSDTGDGYWLVATDGGIFSFGDAEFYGSTGNIRLNQPIVGMAAQPDGGGYWFVASDGGVFSFGTAEFYGTMGGTKLVRPVVGMAATTSC
ncbi:MAG: SpoIID/LytB domain-containing protein, partial [Acidimicrobiales bacterium]